jgi:hypothetical protein
VQDPRLARAADVDTGSLYERTRRQFIALTVALSDEQLQLQVPATPDWSVRDVLAHVVGLAADLNAQRFPEPDDVGGMAWTAIQVERSRGLTLAEVVAEWDREAAAFEAGLRAFGYETGSHFVADLHAHFQDERSAVGLPAAADELTVAVALDHYLGYFDDLLTGAAWGTLDVVAAGESRQLGTHGQHRARVRATLRIAAGSVRKAFSPSDTCARLGGRRRRPARAVADQLHRWLRAPRGRSRRVTTLGVGSGAQGRAATARTWPRYG